MHHAATGSKAQGTANTGTRLAPCPTKLQDMMQKLSRGRGPQRQHTTTHTTCKQAEHVGAREHCQKQTAVVLYMHGSWPTTKGSTVSSTLAHAAMVKPAVKTPEFLGKLFMTVGVCEIVINPTGWPSGPRRVVQVCIRKGAGSNPVPVTTTTE
jgi:hypothetical protein